MTQVLFPQNGTHGGGFVSHTYERNGWLKRSQGQRTRTDYSYNPPSTPDYGHQGYEYLYDPQGNLVQRQRQGNNAADVMDTTLYDAYGLPIADTDVATGQLEAYQDPVGFGGQHGYYHDTETGLSLLTNRYYAPKTGRFLTRDPIGYRGGINLYGFDGNDPVNHMDPEGTRNTGTYWGDVWQVILGYGDVLNPVKAYQSGKSLYTIGRTQGASAAGRTFVKGTVQAYTAWTTTSDPREFGQSFGTVLATAAAAGSPFAKGLGFSKIMNSSGIVLESRLTPQGVPYTGATLIKVSVRGTQKFRVDYGRLPDKANILTALRNKNMLHYHRPVKNPPTGESFPGQGIGRHRPWERGQGGRF